MSVEGITGSPAEFVRRDDESYNVRVVTSDGGSYYESYHYEQICDFFAIEHQLRRQELPAKISGSHDDFCHAFERDADRKSFANVSFAIIQYEGVKPASVFMDPGTRSPTVKEVLGLDADLGTRRIMKDEDDVLCHWMAWKHLSQ